MLNKAFHKIISSIAFTTIIFVMSLQILEHANGQNNNTSIADSNTNLQNTTMTAPIDSFTNPEGYAIAKKHVYDAPLLDVHLYCSNTSGRLMATCILFDGNSTNSALMGVEYIISSEQYASLPEREKPNWSPISVEEEAEVRYPNLSPQQVQELSTQFEGSYVKLIMTWNPNDSLPSYPPQVVIESLLHEEISSPQ